MEKKKKLFFTSLDIIIYATFIFGLGIAVGLGFGRYKNSRFYFAEEKLKEIEAANLNFTKNNAQIEAAVKDKIEPLITTLKNRFMESGKIDLPPKQFTFTRNFTTVPDFITGLSGIYLNLVDGQQTFWSDEVKYTVTNTGVSIDSTQPELDAGVYWIALPGLSSS